MTWRTKSLLVLSLLLHGGGALPARADWSADEIVGHNLRRVGTVGIATLEGFDEFTPSDPPRKYRVLSLSGQVETMLYEDALGQQPLKTLDVGKTESGLVEGTNFPGTLFYTFSYSGGTNGTLVVSFSQQTTPPWRFNVGFPGSAYPSSAGIDIPGAPHPSLGPWDEWNNGGNSPVITRTAQQWPGTKALLMTKAGINNQTSAGGFTQPTEVHFDPATTLTEALAYHGQVEYLSPTQIENQGAVVGELYDPAEGEHVTINVTGLGSVQDAADRLGAGLFDTPALTATTRTLSAKADTAQLDPLHNVWRRISSCNLADTLQNEDTEELAMARASTTVSSSATAHYEMRGPDDGDADPFTFSFGEVTVSADFTLVPGDYLFHYDYARRLMGSNDPWVSHRPGAGSPGYTPPGNPYEQRHVSSPEHTATRTIPRPADPDPYEYTITRITALGPWCESDLPGQAEHLLGSVRSYVSLDRINALISAGVLFLHAEALWPQVYTPSALGWAGPEDHPELTVGRDELGVLRQLRTPLHLVDIRALDTPEVGFEIAFHPVASPAEPDAETGLFTLTGTPSVVHRYENPDAGLPGPATRLRITEIRGSSNKITDYICEPGVQGVTWRLIEGGGLRTIEKQEVAPADEDRVVTRTLRDENGLPVAVTETTYRAFPWGEERIQQILDPGGAHLSTVWHYYDDAETDAHQFGRLRAWQDAQGYWERLTYEPTEGRIATLAMSHLGRDLQAADHEVRVLAYAYDPLPDQDGDGVDEACETTVEWIEGVEVSRSYHIRWSQTVPWAGDLLQRESLIAAHAPGAVWSSPDNLHTETLRLASGDFEGRLVREMQPDGTGSLVALDWSSPDGVLVETVAQGQLDLAATALLSGEVVVSWLDRRGHLLEREAYDRTPGRADLLIASKTATQFDAEGRPIRWDFLDGTHETLDYACCGPARTRDRAGNVVVFDYDVLGRVVREHHGHGETLAFTRTVQHDAADRQIAFSEHPYGQSAPEPADVETDFDLAGRI